MKLITTTLLQFSLLLTIVTLSQQFELHKCCPEGYLLNGNFSSNNQLQQCIWDTRGYRTFWYPHLYKSDPPHETIQYNKFVPKTVEDRMKHIYSRCNVHQLVTIPYRPYHGNVIDNQGVFQSAPSNLQFTGAEFCMDNIDPWTSDLQVIVTCPCFRQPSLCQN